MNRSKKPYVRTVRTAKRITHRNGRRVSKQALQSGSTLRNGKLGFRRPKTRLSAEDLAED
jgi:hypothetical protein